MPAKKERNKELVLKRLSNPKRWSFRRLGRFFNMDVRAAWDIFQRDKDKYGTPSLLASYNKLLKEAKKKRR